MPTYPIDLPLYPKVKSLRWNQKTVNSFVRNPFSGAQQVYVFGGGWWEVDILFTPCVRDQAQNMIGALQSLNGKQGTFNFGDPVGANALGAWGSGPYVYHPSGAGYGYTGTAINVRGLTPNQSLAIRAGDFFTINNVPGLYRANWNVASDANGQAFVEFFPALRGTAYHGYALSYTGCKGIFRLKDDTVLQWDEGPLSMGLAVSAMEAI